MKPLFLSSVSKLNQTFLRYLCVIFFTCFLTVLSQGTYANTTTIRQLVQLAEYIGVDYPEAILDARVINQAEFEEMLEFSAILKHKSLQMSEQNPVFLPVYRNSLALEEAIQNKRDVVLIRELSADIRRALLKHLPTTSLPSSLLPDNRVAELFDSNCSVCHGSSGLGDGSLSKQLSPPPTDFSDKHRAMNRSILGLYESISEGIDETSMPAFKQLSDDERWSLAFYVGGIAFEPAIRPNLNSETNISLEQFTLITPALLISESEEYKTTIEWLRANPTEIFSIKNNPIQFTISQLHTALNAYEAGHYASAHDLAVTAYLEGFELVETSLDAKNPSLRRNIESNMMQLRNQLKQPNQHTELQATLDATIKLLDQAESVINEGNLSKATLFGASFLILMREGLEALLIVIALGVVLIKAQRRDALKFVHAGWTVALFMGVITWLVAQSIFEISGADRETMEGTAALLAAVVLLYVGVWMHSKTQASQWQTYIQKALHDRLKKGTLWGISGLTFIAVYREVFETVLFYQALLTQASSTQESSILAGFLCAIGFLAILAWVLTRFSLKLPISTFFTTTTYLLLALAFVLMGKGVSALQEAALISASPLPFNFELDWIGMKSTWQGVIAQASVPGIFWIMLALSKNKQHLPSA